MFYYGGILNQNFVLKFILNVQLWPFLFLSNADKFEYATRSTHITTKRTSNKSYSKEVFRESEKNARVLQTRFRLICLEHLFNHKNHLFSLNHQFSELNDFTLIRRRKKHTSFY